MGLAALVLALCLGGAWAAVTASYEVADAQLSYLPFFPPQFITAGIVTITADEPIFVHGGKCATNNLCNETNLVPCCAVRPHEQSALLLLPLFFRGDHRASDASSSPHVCVLLTSLRRHSRRSVHWRSLQQTARVPHPALCAWTRTRLSTSVGISTRPRYASLCLSFVY